MITVVSIVGTRADIIKMSILIDMLNASNKVNHLLIYSNQHKKMGIRKLDEFNITEYRVVNEGHQVTNELSKLSESLKFEINSIKPTVVLVHGDTLTAIAGALASHSLDISIAHIEAGLRSKNFYSPYPEEINRTIITKLAQTHFCPTRTSFENLIAEGITAEDIYLTGNTIVDVVRKVSPQSKNIVGISVLITTHRRESWYVLPEIMSELVIDFINKYNNISFVILSHPNPLIYDIYKAKLAHAERVTLVCEDRYDSCINHIHNSTFIATDSCGIQEEAAILGIPAIILRNETERPESISQGCAVLSSVNKDDIYSKMNMLIQNKQKLNSMRKKINDFGDGLSSMKICKLIENYQ